MKMGKSLGNTLEPNELVEIFGVDSVRYSFLREVEFGNNGDFSEDRFINIVNACLTKTVGNLLNRTIGLLEKTAKLPCWLTWMFLPREIHSQKLLRSWLLRLEHIMRISLSSPCEAVLEIGNAGNSHMDKHAPWSLFKKGGAAAEAVTKDLVIILETMRIIAVALSPVAPSLCWTVHERLGYTKDQYNAITWNDTRWGGLKGGPVMAQPKPVFARIEGKVEEKVA